MKNGLPSVSRCSARARAMPGSASSWPAAAVTSPTTAASSRPCSARRSHAGLAAPVGQHRRQRMRAREIRVAVGADDQQSERHGRAQDVLEQHQLGRAGPLQVVEDEDDRRFLRGVRSKPVAASKSR